MLIFLYIGEDIDFVDGALLQFFILLEPAHLDDFDSVLFVIVLVYGPIDLTVGSLPYNFVECVVLNNANHGLFRNNYYKCCEMLLPSKTGKDLICQSEATVIYIIFDILIKIFIIPQHG
jgi:hypothetical protein